MYKLIGDVVLCRRICRRTAGEVTHVTTMGPGEVGGVAVSEYDRGRTIGDQLGVQV